MPIKIKELPELERPYEKLEWYGEKVLSNAELLAIIIKTGTKQETSVQLAQKILNLNDTKSEGINFLRNISIEELMQINGIGKVKAIQLKAVGELANRMTMPSNYKKITIKEPYDLAKLVELIEKGTISSAIGKKVVEELFENPKDPEEIIKEKGWLQISDEGAIKAVVQKVIANNPQSVADYKAGKDKAIGFLVGQAMKETKGKANPQMLNKMFVEELKK